MSQPNIDVLCTEANRLLDLSIQFLQWMSQQKGVVSTAMQGEAQTFDQASLGKHVEVLQGEKTKLESLDMVLAVIGTMKAGKSTTINAIVGSEVLPNRNRPMTALPTLIRHTPGQVEPLLKFDNNGPINQLLDELVLLVNQPQLSAQLDTLTDNPDMQELLRRIHEKQHFETRYQGAEQIFWFLKSLNDLVRLSQVLGAAFPFEHYDEVHEMPVIEVEFAHLRHMANARGRLTLLDTPGPNEAGQSHLRVMMKEQLAKASAILAVMNYGQLKSDADDEVREQLKNIARTANGRLFALVNRYDEKDRNGDSIEEIKRLVASDLMKGFIDEAHVYPVSARQAYLANRALHELALHGRLPASNQQAWVEDFGNEAIGRRWESKIEDAEEVKDAASELWQESLFNVPMEKVVQTAYAQAAVYAIDAASAKLVDITHKLDNFLSLRKSALSRNAEELKCQITSLIEDSRKIDNAEEEAGALGKSMLYQIDRNSAAALKKLHTEMEASLDQYFREGKNIEKIQHSELAQQESQKKKQRSDGTLGFFLKNVLNNSWGNGDSQDFDPNSPVLRFSDKDEVDTLLKRLVSSIEKIMKSGESNLIDTIQHMQQDFRKDFEGSIGNMVAELVATVKDRLSADGFSIEIRLPPPRFPSLHMSGLEMLENMVQERSETVTRSRRKSGVWGGICKFFNTDDWGWEDYQTTKEYYELDMRKIRAATQKSIAQTFKLLQNAIAEMVQQPLEQEVQNYFATFRSKVENIRADMQQGIRDKEGSKKEQEELALAITNLLNKLPVLKSDCDELAEDLKPLLQHEGA
ncbi:dynamin family protein [Vogesella indigofera]|uniref:dynamin family protein n=1 Tax=Vogesella indigofera TaxID=45465 RepID=UPI00234ECAB2|nr:dynamin family protein [Vogesella indigofera]MDC7701637.1 dynamin family protein [Vogesella indigofera]